MRQDLFEVVFGPTNKAINVTSRRQRHTCFVHMTRGTHGCLLPSSGFSSHPIEPHKDQMTIYDSQRERAR